jgi:hypothetical protein
MPIVNHFVMFKGERRMVTTIAVNEERTLYMETRDTFTKNDLYAFVYGAEPAPVEREIILSCEVPNE